MKGIVEFIETWFVSAQSVQIRSQIIVITGVEFFNFDMSTIEPYSFTIVNTGSKDMLINGVTVVKGANANSQDTMLDFPRVGIFKRSDIIKITSDGIGNIEGFIRADLELTG